MSRFGKELAAKLWLAERIKQISLGENTNPQANQSVMETIFNRASARGTSLEAATQEYTGRGSKGYYPASTFAGGARNLRNPKMAAMAEKHRQETLGGGNVSSYATRQFLCHR